MNDRNIVIPTFVGDQDLLIWQIKCFDRFLSPPLKLHYVLTGQSEFNKHLAQLINNLKITYNNHEIIVDHCDELEIWHSLPADIKNRGWIAQQIIKLFYPLDTPYLVMDTKDLVLKPCDWHDIFQHHSLTIPKNVLIDPYYEFWDTLEKVYPSGPILTRGFSTPQIIDPTVVDKLTKKFNGVDHFLEWFGSFVYPSEFLLYDYAQQYHGFRDVAISARHVNYVSLRHVHQASTAEMLLGKFQEFENNPMIRIFKIHRAALENNPLANTIMSWIDAKLQTDFLCHE
jgi:hypothetical protein